jgi:hypothetical protein
MAIDVLELLSLVILLELGSLTFFENPDVRTFSFVTCVQINKNCVFTGLVNIHSQKEIVLRN